MVHFAYGRPYVSGFSTPFGYYADYAREISSMCGLGGQQFMDAYQQRHSFDETIRSSIRCVQLEDESTTGLHVS